METTERYKLNKELAQMLKGGVIMDVTTPAVLDILQRLRFFRPSRSITSMRARFSHQLMTYITSTRDSSRFHLYVVQRILARHSEESTRVHQ